MALEQPQVADVQSWAMLLLLSAIWGGSFFFIAVAVKDLSTLQIVFARVAIAAAVLMPIHLFLQGPLPTSRRTWVAAGGMSVMNNVLPFTLITWGQHTVSGGLASVVNATTPMFAVIFMALAGFEKLSTRKVFALCVGFIGVAVLQGADFSLQGQQSVGVFAVALAAACYGLSAPWSKKMLVGIPPLTTATCQLTLSSLLMGLIVLVWGNAAEYHLASTQTWLAVLGLAVVSTSVAYLLFFRIIVRAGPTFVSLCTMIIPVSAILLGYIFLGEKLTTYEISGALIIGLSLLLIDGRFLDRFKPQKAAR
jgi:drug/metabolite transporter (DMT)-like permease